MFWERFSELCYSNNVSANAVCAKLGLSTATATHWKNGTMPKGDVLVKIADYFDVSVDYLLMRVDSPRLTKEKRKNTMDNNFDIKKLSSAQRAMLKYRIDQLMLNKFRNEDYFDELNDELSVTDSKAWFMNLYNYSLDDKMPQMLAILNIDYGSLFNDMRIVIETKCVALRLGINLPSDGFFPILVSGDKVFNALQNMTVQSLSKLDNGILEQIDINEIHPSENIGEDLCDDLKSSLKATLQV